MLLQHLPWTELESSEAPMHGRSSKINSQGSPSSKEPFFSLGKSVHPLTDDQETQEFSPTNGDHSCKFPSGRALEGQMAAHSSGFIQSEAAPASTPTLASAPWIISLDSNSHEEQLNSLGRHASGSPDSSTHPSGGENIGSTKDTGKDESLKSSDAKEDGEEASVKGSGSSALNYSDLEAADDGSFAYAASASDLGLHKKSHQLYTLRRNPRPSKRFKVEEYAMEMVPSTASRKSMIITEKTGEGYECTECGRAFASSKALFGHMRCHPERDWRGIHRPKCDDKSVDSEIKNPQSSSDIQWKNSPTQSGDHLSNLHSKYATDAESIEAAYMHRDFKSHLQRWKKGKRSKRSRKSMKPLQTIQSTVGIKEDKDMADCLVLLARAGNIQEELEPARKRAAFGLVNWVERHKQIKTESKDGETEVKMKRDWSRSKVDSWREESCEFGEYDEFGEKEETGDGDVGFKYECYSCKRVFKSHQALGGHRASHRKVKGCFARAHAFEGWPYSPDHDLTEEDPPDEKPNLIQPIQGTGGMNSKSSNKFKLRSKSELMKKIKGHECSICHKVFQSGQALGGHKRCHWSGPASSDTSTPHSYSQKHELGILEKGRTCREELLDLNLPAPEEVADGTEEVAEDSNPEFKTKSLKIRMPFNPSRLNPSLNILNERSHFGDGGQIMESRTSINYEISKKPLNSNGKDSVVQDLGSVSQEFMANSSAFHPWYVHHDIYDQVSASASDLKNHERTYTSTIALVAGRTPIST